MEYNVTLGSPTVLFPWLDDQYRGSGDAYKRTGELLETIGQAIRSKGLHFLYHTHGYEFDSYAGRTGLDILLQQTTAEAVGVEIDTFWVEHGGVDALVLYNELADRCLNIHFKDSKDKNDWCDTEVGDGVIGVADIIHAAYGKPTEWFVVEQEKFDRPPLDSAKISCLNLRRLIKENYKL
jgi:sugar phosphate isomerase/epimerase